MSILVTSLVTLTLFGCVQCNSTIFNQNGTVKDNDIVSDNNTVSKEVSALNDSRVNYNYSDLNIQKNDNSVNTAISDNNTSTTSSSSSSFTRTTSTSTTATTTTSTTSTTTSTTTPSTTIIVTTSTVPPSTILSTEPPDNNKTASFFDSFNKNYLYLLLLLIPIFGILFGICFYYKRKKKQDYAVPTNQKTRKLSTPSWVFSEPECEDEVLETLQHEKL